MESLVDMGGGRQEQECGVAAQEARQGEMDVTYFKDVHRCCVGGEMIVGRCEDEICK